MSAELVPSENPDNGEGRPHAEGPTQVLRGTANMPIVRDAGAEARRRHHHRRHVRALDRALGCDPYPDIEAAYPRVELRESPAHFAALLREHAGSAS